MPNIAAALREEISRLARKEIRNQTESIRKASAEYRKRIAELKRQVTGLQRKVATLEKHISKKVPSKVKEADAGRVRFSAKGLKSHREKLGLSAADYGKLIGVTGQTVYKWEKETTKPRGKQIAAVASIRGIGKREALKRLEKMGKEGG